jgi:glucan phosphorylase
MFKQLIKDGYQAEVPDVWLEQGNPWEIKRHDIRFQVGFSGKTVTDKGKTTWIPGEKVRRGLDVHIRCCSTGVFGLGSAWSSSCAKR